MKKAFFFLLLLITVSGYTQYTNIPDLNFEEKLISLGIDNGNPDSKVLTSAIAVITS